jgi:NAD/NADP transhydrogenase alpha subunit
MSNLIERITRQIKPTPPQKPTRPVEDRDQAERQAHAIDPVIDAIALAAKKLARKQLPAKIGQVGVVLTALLAVFGYMPTQTDVREAVREEVAPIREEVKRLERELERVRESK